MPTSRVQLNTGGYTLLGASPIECYAYDGEMMFYEDTALPAPTAVGAYRGQTNRDPFEVELPGQNVYAIALNGPASVLALTTPVDVGDMKPVAVTPATANGAILFDVDTTGFDSLVTQLKGTFVGTVQWEGSLDRQTWTAVAGFNAAAIGTAAGASTDTNGTILRAFVALPKFMRGRVTAFTSGTIDCTAILRDNDGIINSIVVTAAGGSLSAIPAGNGNGAGNTITPFKSTAGVAYLLLKNAAANVYNITLSNNTATDKWLKLINATTTPTAASVSYTKFRLPPGITRLEWSIPLRMATGFGAVISGGMADNDATALAVDDVTGVFSFA